MYVSNTLHRLCFSLCVIFLFTTACKQDPKTDTDQLLQQQLTDAAPANIGLDFFKLPESHEYSKIPQDPLNPITRNKVALGKLLFHETELLASPKNPDGKGTVSCASCHHADAGFAAGIAQGLGEGGIGFGIAGEGRIPDPNYPLDLIDVQPLKTPTAMNTAWQELMLWNGQFGATGDNAGTEANWTTGTPKAKNFLGYQGVEVQAVAGLGVHRMEFDAEWVTSKPTYKYLFDLAFADVDEDKRYSVEFAGLAIAAYERTILANQSPWQQWLKGDQNALTDLEKEGALLFFGKAECNNCHTGPALNSMEFHCIGLNDLQTGTYGAINIDGAAGEHKGRGNFTGDDNQLYQFKVPQLYNLRDFNFYGHGSSLRSVEDMIRYKNEAVPENTALPASRMAPGFQPLGLTDAEIDALTAFLENALYDPNLNRYVPDHIPSGNCFPNNDTQSRQDRGCE